jgi:hypothetical protein
VLLAKLKYLSNRQGAKNAKDAIPTPRYILGGFEKGLAAFPEGHRDGVRSWRFKKTTLNRETIKRYKARKTSEGFFKNIVKFLKNIIMFWEKHHYIFLKT